MADLFISYSRKDRDFVRKLHKALGEQDRDIWIDWEDIPPTVDWLEVYSAIEAADTFAFVISPNSVASETCNGELDHAVKHNKRIVPVVHRDVNNDVMPKALVKPNWIYLRESDSFCRGIQILMKALDTDLDWVRAHTRFLVRAVEWDGKGKDNKSYALRGSDLQDSLEWLAKAHEGKEPKPTSLQTEYIRASQKFEASEMRRLRELYDKALARQLAAQSELTRSHQANLLQRSILLAVESMRRFLSLEGDQALRHGLALLARPVAAMNYDSGVKSVAFSPDGKYLATVGYDKTTRIWRAAAGEEIARMSHKERVFSVAFSPDGKYLATASDYRTARVWKAATGEQIAHMVHRSGVTSVAFSEDGKYLVTTGRDNSARLWLICPKDLMDEACSRLTRNLTYGEWQQYLTDEPYHKTCEKLPVRCKNDPA